MAPFPRRRILLWTGLGAALALAAGLGWRLTRQVSAALEAAPRTTSPLQFQELPAPPFPVRFWGGGEVAAVALAPEALLTAGASGVADGGGTLSAGLPSLRATALALWRGQPVVGLASGGLFRRRDGHWEEARSGFQDLQVRALLEGPGGELWIGARQGLFLAPWGAGTLERLDAAPVKALALAPDGTLLAGGERGLRGLAGRTVRPLATPDPWVEWVGIQGRDLLVLTPLGLARGPLDGPLQPVRGAQEARSAALAGDLAFAAVPGRLLRLEPGGAVAEEWLPAPPRRVLAAAGQVFADTDRGLFHRGPEGWALVRPRPGSLPPGPSHVNALALWNGKVALGLFDGGVLLAEARDGDLGWKPLAGSGAWGVNALLGEGGALAIASLRGAFRHDGRRTESLGQGPAHALALLPGGLAVGFGHGLRLPDGRMLSAFHGLPGNQTLALLGGDELLAGTPSGVGAVVASRVAWRAAAGDGRLPNPWVNALARFQDQVYLGTYGGGVARRVPEPEGRVGPGRFDAFPETRGFKVNPGCLAEAGGRLYLGTEGRGLYRLSEDRTRFLPVPAPLPSPRVTALLQNGDTLLVGTDEGLARLPLASLREGP